MRRRYGGRGGFDGGTGYRPHQTIRPDTDARWDAILAHLAAGHRGPWMDCTEPACLQARMTLNGEDRHDA